MIAALSLAKKVFLFRHALYSTSRDSRLKCGDKKIIVGTDGTLANSS